MRVQTTAFARQSQEPALVPTASAWCQPSLPDSSPGQPTGRARTSFACPRENARLYQTFRIRGEVCTFERLRCNHPDGTAVATGCVAHGPFLSDVGGGTGIRERIDQVLVLATDSWEPLGPLPGI